MKTRALYLLGIALACLPLASLTAGVTMDVAMQQVLREYGVDTKIVRPCTVLKETSDRSDGQFLFVLDGRPGVQVLLDRDYWILATSDAKQTDDVFGFMLNPKDEQSALNITMGNDMHERSDADLAKDPGFSGVRRGGGVVAEQKIVWRRWSDQNHLYSDCTLSVPLRSAAKDKIFKVNIAITANTESRRKTLEECMASLKLRETTEKNTPNKAPVPTATAVTPAADAPVAPAAAAAQL